MSESSSRGVEESSGDVTPGLGGGDGLGDGSIPPLVDPNDDLLDSSTSRLQASDDRPERFAAAIGVRFKDLGILRTALTHRSVLHHWAAAGLMPTDIRSNERLEFLGDAVLGAIAADDLYGRFPDADEGDLTKRRVALVRAESLVRWAREIDLGDYLYLGQGERVTEGARDRMLAGAFEAVVGAIALDRGQREVRRFVRPFLAQSIPEAAAPAETNPKGLLQEVLQERFRRSPAYHVSGIDGPDHARVFTVEATLDSRVLGEGSGVSKREAEQHAAQAALAALATDPPAAPHPSFSSGASRRKRGREKVVE